MTEYPTQLAGIKEDFLSYLILDLVINLVSGLMSSEFNNVFNYLVAFQKWALAFHVS